MAKAFLSGINLAGTELQNAIVQNLATAPAHAAGRIYYDTVLGYFRVSNGTAWTNLAVSGTDTEAVQDIVNAMITGSTVVTAAYNDAAGTIALSIGTGQVTNGMLAGSIDQSKVTNLTTDLASKVTGFADPDADRIVFWDDSAGSYQPLTPGTGLTITATTIAVATASETASGIVELATAAETTTGTDTTRAVHPAGLKVELDKKSNTGHTHTASNITDFQTTVSANTDVTANTTARHTHSNKSTLDATTAAFTTADETKLDSITTDAVAGTGSLRTLGTGAQQAAAGNHGHVAANISDFQTTVSANTDVAANTAARHTHSNSAVLNATTASFTTADETKLDGLTQYTDTMARANRLDQFAAPTTSVSMNGQRLTSVATPTAGTDAANKDYVDGVASGLDVKASVRAATTAAGTLASSFANGSVIDGVTLVTGNRILIKNQATATENGIYTVNATGAPTRAADADSNTEVTSGMFAFVEEGTTNGDTGWILTNNGAITLGTTGLTFTQFSGAGTYTAGAGLTQTGTTFDVGAGTGISVNANDVAVDTAVVVRKYAATIGNASLTTITVTHNLNTQDITYSVRDATTNEFVECDVNANGVNTATFTFATAPGTNAYRVVIHG